MKTVNEVILDAYKDIVYKKDEVSEAPRSDQEGVVMSNTADAVLLLNKIQNAIKKSEPHYPDIVMHLKKAATSIGKAQKAASK